VLEEPIGQGAYSTVYRAFRLQEIAPRDTFDLDARDLEINQYACKVFRRKNMTRRMVKNIFEETSSFAKMGAHPNIANFVA
jgi:serine/threonine protein kinase